MTTDKINFGKLLIVVLNQFHAKIFIIPHFLVLLGSRDTIIEKKVEIDIYLYSMINIDKNIENGMMKWRDENDGLEDNGRMVKNKEIKQLGNWVKMIDCLKKREQIYNRKRKIVLTLSMQGIIRESQIHILTPTLFFMFS